MNDRDRQACVATMVGALIGGVAGYLFFTDAGRQIRRRIEPALDDLSRELNSFRGTVERAAGMATEGWKMLNEMAGESAQQPSARYSAPPSSQTSPF